MSTAKRTLVAICLFASVALALLIVVFASDDGFVGFDAKTDTESLVKDDAQAFMGDFIEFTQQTVQDDVAAGARRNTGCIGECEKLGFTDLSGQQNVTLENVHISNPNGQCLNLNNSNNIVIKNSIIGPCGTNTAVDQGYRTGMILINDADTVRLEGNLIEEISNPAFVANRNNAVWVNESTNVTIIDNEFRNIYSDISRKSDNQGNRAVSATGRNDSFKLLHNSFFNAGRNALQYAFSQNVANVEVSFNRVEGDAVWESDYEDMFNFYASTGTADSPIIVKGNYFRNGGPSTSGTGLIIGDGNQSQGTNAHFIIEDNVFVDPGNVGLGIAGGSDLVVRNNRIYADNYSQMHDISVGMYINQFNYGPTCDRIVVEGNRVFFNNNKHPSGSGVNHVWNPGTCTGATLSNNVFGDTSLSAAIWDLD